MNAFPTTPYDAFNHMPPPTLNNGRMICYLWIIRPDISKEGIHILVEFKPIQSQIFSNVQHTHVSTNKDNSNIRQHVKVITQMVSDEPSTLYPDAEEDDDTDED
ncbi:hypothetical protein M9H77_16273 [Catharanthus roseus]|uniref:Uncharacterized protein n=1 Tax=Catharanthus roseus TaxID=4058 RepID=A0ACC0B1B4_CATRO|nr:hypothetical protein M9H77_16273 [Catharanthus roseus]